MRKCDTLYVAEIKFVLLQRKSLSIILDRSFFKFEQIYHCYILDITGIVYYCYAKLSSMI